VFEKVPEEALSLVEDGSGAALEFEKVPPTLSDAIPVFEGAEELLTRMREVFFLFFF
jgi:hypothetical protein